MLWLDGVYEPVAARPDKPRLRCARAPTSAQLTQLAGKIAHRVCRHLARQGWLERAIVRAIVDTHSQRQERAIVDTHSQRAIVDTHSQQ